MLVRVIKDWDSDLDLNRQSPEGDGKWENFVFTTDPIESCDLLVVLNRPKEDITVRCPPGNKFLIIMEPFTPAHRWYKRCFHEFDRIFSPFPAMSGNMVRTHGSLPWHINRSYGELVALEPGEISKHLDCSFITSNLGWMKGHDLRLNLKSFIEQNQLSIDIFGKGFRFVEDKADALMPYKYSLVVENTRQPHYWTEKLADCFLNYTIPLYDGAPGLKEYFPEGSYIPVDANNPPSVIEKLQKAINENYWENHLNDLEEARNRILDQYQLLPSVYNYFQQYGNKNTGLKSEFHIKKLPAPWEPGGEITMWRKAEYRFRKLFNIKPF